MPTLPTNPHAVGDSGHVNDHNLIVTALAGAVYATGQTGTVDLSGATVKGAGLDLIYAANFTTAAEVIMDGKFAAAYRNYRIIFQATGSAAAALSAQLRLSGTNAAGASDYKTQSLYSYGTVVTAAGSSAGSWELGAVRTSVENALSMDIYSPAAAQNTGFTLLMTDFDTNLTGRQHVGRHVLNTAYDGMRIYPASGTVTGRVKLYGYRD